ncbi:MAG: prepilin-type N-terminal cleavage/methylation domain-containing protein [Deltaproteobacteria bacterium]|nr:prepilin-type N-terminal cleavage/methylation domain-containing protein [Deltaproteobacteria bacterium]
MRKNRAFTLVEMAIVLVVIGFLMGAVIQGQKMFYNARMQRIVSDLQDFAKVFLIYYEQQGMYPGDENDTAFPPGDTANGDHDGLVDPGEADNVWQDLSHAMGVVRKASPVRGGVYEFGNQVFYGASSQNYVRVTNIPNRMAQSIDAKHDDGTYDAGNIRTDDAYTGSDDDLTVLYWRI